MSKLLINGHEVPWSQDGYLVEFVCDGPETIGPVTITTNETVTIRPANHGAPCVYVRTTHPTEAGFFLDNEPGNPVFSN